MRQILRERDKFFIVFAGFAALQWLEKEWSRPECKPIDEDVMGIIFTLRKLSSATHHDRR